jgi:type III pantothenate kinase
MILVIDVGNTRLKWSWLSSTGLSAQQAVVHRAKSTQDWADTVFEPRHRPRRVLISNVAGEAMAALLQRLCLQHFSVEAEFITPTRSFLELTNGYLNPSLLGADRWLAVIGAWTLARTALCVVDAGTAVKVDSVNAHGQHLGGLIIPGLNMMRESLLINTSDISAAIAGSNGSLAGILANNTIGAISRGAVLAVAGMADRAAEIIEQRTGEHPRLFVTGGDAEAIIGTMGSRAEIVPDLVLQGIAVIATQSTQAAIA